MSLVYAPLPEKLQGTGALTCRANSQSEKPYALKPTERAPSGFDFDSPGRPVSHIGLRRNLPWLGGTGFLGEEQDEKR